MNGMDAVSRTVSQTKSLFSALEELEQAVSDMRITADYVQQVADRYLGPPDAIGCAEKPPKEPEDATALRRIRKMISHLSEAGRSINYNLNRLSE